MTAAQPEWGALDDLAWSFGDRLRKVRKQRTGLGQREFAQQLDVKWQAYAQWEAENSKPKDIVAVAKRIEILTGVPAAWMLGVDEPVSPGRHSVTDSVTSWLRTDFRSSDTPSSLVSQPQLSPERLAELGVADLSTRRRANRLPGLAATLAVG